MSVHIVFCFSNLFSVLLSLLFWCFWLFIILSSWGFHDNRLIICNYKVWLKPGILSSLLFKVTSSISSIPIQPKQPNPSSLKLSFLSVTVHCYCQSFWKESISIHCEFLCYWNVTADKIPLLGSLIFSRILSEGNFWNIFREQFARGFIWTDFRGINCTQQRLAWRTPNVKERRSMSKCATLTPCGNESALPSLSTGFPERKEKNEKNKWLQDHKHAYLFHLRSRKDRHHV